MLIHFRHILAYEYIWTVTIEKFYVHILYVIHIKHFEISLKFLLFSIGNKYVLLQAVYYLMYYCVLLLDASTYTCVAAQESKDDANGERLMLLFCLGT